MSRSSLVVRRSMLAIFAVAVVAAGLLAAPATSLAATAAPRAATKGFRIFAKSPDAARGDALRFLQTLPADGALSDWRAAAISQCIPVQAPDGSAAVYVVTFSTSGGYAGYVTIDALPSANPVLEFSRNPAPVFASEAVAQARVGAAKSAPRVKRQVYVGPLSYAVETVAASGTTETVPVGALMQATSADAIRGPPAVGSVSAAAVGSVAVSSLGTNYKMIANMPDYDQFTYNYTSSEYNSGTIPAASGTYAASPYLNAGSYYSGCAPTAAGDVVKYWAGNGYPNLFTGKNPTQGGASWEKVVNDLHVYFRTSDDSGSGSTYGSAVAPGLKGYAQGIGGYSFTSVDVGNFTWAAYTGEIDANRPVVLMFQNLNVTAPAAFPYGDHAITGIGYDHTPGVVASEYMIVHDNWPAAPSDVYVQFSGPNTTYDSRDMVTFVPAAAAAPANDTFASGQAIAGSSGSLAGTSVNATKESGEPNHAGDAGGASVWYRWTASAAGTLTVDTFGSGYNTVLAAYTGITVSGLTPVASNDDSGSGLQSRVAFRVTSGTTYRIAVDGSAGASGPVNLDWAFAAAPVAPDAVTATIDSVPPGPVTQGARATFAGSAVDSLGHAINGYEWTSSIDGTISASASFSTTALSPGAHTIGFRARCANGTWSAPQTAILVVTAAPPAAPANDAFSAAQPLPTSSGTISGTSVAATKETGEPAHAGDAGGASIWYVWVAPANGSLSLDTSGSGFDTVLGVYTGASVDALAEKASSDDIAPDNAASRVTLSVVAGTPYRIAIDGYGGASGAVTLDWSFRAPVASVSTVRLSTGGLTRYHYVTITGALKPIRAGAAVRIEILKPGSRTWVRLVTRTTNVAGVWASYRYKVTLRGVYHVRTRFLGDAYSLASMSAYAHLTVR